MKEVILRGGARDGQRLSVSPEVVEVQYPAQVLEWRDTEGLLVGSDPINPVERYVEEGEVEALDNGTFLIIWRYKPDDSIK